jgi:hypothetical protein
VNRLTLSDAAAEVLESLGVTGIDPFASKFRARVEVGARRADVPIMDVHERVQ